VPCGTFLFFLQRTNNNCRRFFFFGLVNSMVNPNIFKRIFYFFQKIFIFATLSQEDVGSAGEQPASNKIANGNIFPLSRLWRLFEFFSAIATKIYFCYAAFLYSSNVAESINFSPLFITANTLLIVLYLTIFIMQLCDLPSFGFLS